MIDTYYYMKKEVNPEEVWNMLIQLGSFDKVSLGLANKGIISPRTKKPIYKKTLSTFIWKWVVDNPNRALELLRIKYPDVSDEYWDEFIVSKAFTVYVTRSHSRELFLKWLKDHGLEKYSDYRKSPYFQTSK